ncbi:MAG: class I SAM-dependent methyltransferase [Myxococcota bacterium]|nr:class I SAM-dependent methyltransferase [Myxococcota bacterium]
MSNPIFVKDGTAQGVAKQRLIESLASPDSRVIHDPYAGNFVLGTGVMKIMGHSFNVWLSQKLAPGFHEHLIARTRFIDDLVEECASQGTEQYVILGAGYDTRANRLSLPSTLKIFEVDQAEVQNRKRSKLPKDVPNLDNITYVTVDFNHQSITEQLLAAGFDARKSTLFTLEGVSQYVPKEAMLSTLQELGTLAQKAKCTFFMSYVSTLLKENPTACFGEGYPNPRKKAAMIQKLSAKVGEPWISFYTAEELEMRLSENGFALVENKTLADLNNLYFSPVGRTLPEEHIFKLEHFVVATTNGNG